MPSRPGPPPGLASPPRLAGMPRSPAVVRALDGGAALAEGGTVDGGEGAFVAPGEERALAGSGGGDGAARLAAGAGGAVLAGARDAELGVGAEELFEGAGGAGLLGQGLA